MKNKVVISFFFLVAFVDLLGLAINIPMLHTIAKPLIIPSLALCYFFNTRAETPNDEIKLVFSALFFSWLGDLALMFAGDIFFLCGLLSFLTAHIFYIVIFNRRRKQTSTKPLLQRKPLLILPFVVYGVILYTYLLPSLDVVLYFAVALYAIIILIMSLAALNRKNSCSGKSFQMVFVGSLLFVISDSALAVNSFAHSFAGAGFLVMLTYIAAQKLIISGLIRK